MDPAENRPKASPIVIEKEDLIAVGHQMQRINACLDVLWRATCHDANHGGYPEFVQHMRQLLGAASDDTIAIAHQAPSVERFIKANLNPTETAPAAEEWTNK